MTTSYTAGCNQVLFQDLAPHSFCNALPQQLMDKYPAINFGVKCLAKHPVMKHWIIFIPDMPHLTKHIVTPLEKLSMKNSKKNLKFGKAPVNLNTIEDIWMRMDGASGQLHSMKLTRQHFEEDLFSQINVKLLVQILSASVVDMIHMGICNNDIVLAMDNKEMYNHIANLYTHWNGGVDTCIGRDGNSCVSPHTHDNAQQRQTILLETLAWFSRWKVLHDERVKEGEANR
jgi:hypothetical protein